jgi:hypothetical protein
MCRIVQWGRNVLRLDSPWGRCVPILDDRWMDVRVSQAKLLLARLHTEIQHGALILKSCDFHRIALLTLS